MKSTKRPFYLRIGPTTNCILLLELAGMLLPYPSLAGSSLPKSIEILCSTYVEGKKCTEVAAACINYVDYETNEVRSSFSFQFHPELLSDLREFQLSGEPSHEKLKSDDGVRMLLSVLYERRID